MQRTTTTSTAALSALLACAMTATACGTQVEDRAGGTAGGDVEVLTFAQPNHGTPEQLAAWAEQVDQLSRGTLRIDFEEAWRMGEPDFEARTIEDVEDGAVDMAWVGARALDRAGVTSFQALLAPLLVDSYPLQEEVFEAGIPSRMLGDVDRIGVLGIGALPGPMRKVLGVSKPFRSPQDFSGAV